MDEIELPNPEELKEKRDDRFSKRVALVTAIYAVFLAIASLGGSHAMKGLLVSSQEASNQWAYYQSKAIREHTYKIQGQVLQVRLMEIKDSMKPEIVEKYESTIKMFSEEQERFNKEKQDIELKAREQSELREKNGKKDPYFEYAEVLLQISIVLASVAIISHSYPVFYASICAATAGIFMVINGFFLFVNIPFLD
ncbi:MAG: DUF4337 domain-containing protein [Candidatus Magnetominusculus sp. LBB02]|nr:DUF4337 domain-containing protein [Candidatus Magnetominusculus sp. LBB02]